MSTRTAGSWALVATVQARSTTGGAAAGSGVTAGCGGSGSSTRGTANGWAVTKVSVTSANLAAAGSFPESAETSC
ncbi:hypothetical protein GCM10010452_35630 [Crossiella cryophila]